MIRRRITIKRNTFKQHKVSEEVKEGRVPQVINSKEGEPRKLEKPTGGGEDGRTEGKSISVTTNEE